MILAEVPKIETIIAVTSFLGSAAFMIFIAGRWSQKLESHKDQVKGELNGIGTRVSKVELGLEHGEGRMEALELQMSRTQGQYDALIKILGEAKGSVDQFRSTVQLSGDKLERKIDDMRREQSDTKLEISQRLVAVETSLQHLESKS